MPKRSGLRPIASEKEKKIMKNQKALLAFGFVLMFAVIFALVPVAPAFSSETKNPPAEATTMPQYEDGWVMANSSDMQIPCGEKIVVCGSTQVYVRETDIKTEIKLLVNFNGYGCIAIFYTDDSKTIWASYLQENGKWFISKETDLADASGTPDNSNCPTKWTVKIVIKNGEKYERTFNLTE